MPKFSNASLAALATCHQDLITLAHEAIKYYDFKVLEGHRGKEAQEAAVRAGTSELHWPHGNHNAFPSNAFDLAPYPLDWSTNPKAIARFGYLAGVIETVAAQLLAEGKIQHRIRWGADWNMNNDPRDENFMDWGHFELHEP